MTKYNTARSMYPDMIKEYTDLQLEAFMEDANPDDCDILVNITYKHETKQWDYIYTWGHKEDKGDIKYGECEVYDTGFRREHYIFLDTSKPIQTQLHM